MNIFILDSDPTLAAQIQVDKHVVKMPLETAQMLCSIHASGVAPYKRTHYNHPSTKWSRESLANYEWLIAHGYALCDEYTRRYDKTHASRKVIAWCEANRHLVAFPTTGLTPFAQAMPDEYKDIDPVVAYQNYYLGEKNNLFAWKNRDVPVPFRDGL